jgi:hypothetical protein
LSKNVAIDEVLGFFGFGGLACGTGSHATNS